MASLGFSALRPTLFLAPGVAYLVAFFVYPMAITVWTSLRSPDGAFTLAHYVRILGSGGYWRVIGLTFFLATATTFTSLLLGIPLALLLKAPIPGRRWMRLLVLTPLMVLALISALGLLIIWGPNGWFNRLAVSALPFVRVLRVNFTVPGLILFYTWLYAPYTILTTLSAIEGIDPNVEEAARVSGAKPRQVLTRITLPLSLPGIRAGSVLTFLLAFGAFSIPLIAGGNHRPLAVLIYTESAIFNNWQVGSALATVMAILAIAAILVYLRITQMLGTRR